MIAHPKIYAVTSAVSSAVGMKFDVFGGELVSKALMPDPKSFREPYHDSCASWWLTHTPIW
jgi:hypothetical protein